MVFDDLAKAFDTVSRLLLWSLLAKYGCPPKFLSVLRALHDGAEARVLCGDGVSDPFPVSAGVFMCTITKVACGAVSPNDCFKLN